MFTWVTGLTATGRQALVLRPPAYGLRLVALCFDLDGYLQGAQPKAGPAERPQHRRRLEYDPQLWAFASELGFTEGPIRVRRFAHADSGVGITDFSTPRRGGRHSAGTSRRGQPSRPALQRFEDELGAGRLFCVLVRR